MRVMRIERAQWPAPARRLASLVEGCLAAAADGDRPAFDDALGRLARLDRPPVASLLGAAVVEALQRAHPAGLDAAAAEALIDSTVGSARGWCPAVDDDLLVRALAGALDLGELPGTDAADGTAVLAHGLLLLATLSTTRAAVRATVDAAMAELIREQTVELP